MAKTVDLQEEEIEVLLSNYRSKLLDIEKQLKPLLDSKSSIEDRIDKLSEGIRKQQIPKLADLNKGKHLFSDVLSSDISKATTLSKKVQYIFQLFHKEFSTGEVYNEVIGVFPDERSKDKVAVIQNISKELGKGAKAGKLYYQSKERDKNGKLKFGLLKWKEKEEAA